MFKWIFLFAYSLRTCISYAQQTESKTNIRVDFFNEPYEIVYLQTDKGIYETGEDLWFKTYTMDAQSLALSDKSKTLFVEVFDAKDSIVWQEKYPVRSGIAEGHIYIDKNLAEGDYRVHAYTRCSFLNDTLRPLYPKKIRVVKNITGKGAERPSEEEQPATRLSFFPEGGHLIDGLPAKVAFKASDGKGMPAKVTGTLQEDGRDIAKLKTMHDGMGFVFVLPRREATYKAVLSDGREFPFTEVAASGLSIHLHKQTDEYLELHLAQPKGAEAQKVKLDGKMRGRLCCTATGTLQERMKVRIPLKEFPTQGIAEFTLYNAAMQPVAERLVYVHPRRKLHIGLEPDSEHYFTRGKGKLSIKVTDEAGKPVRAHLGLSLFDRAYRNEPATENILSYCHLSTEIRGNIHNPAYYFDESNKDRLAALDLLLLTQGWRRYVWEKADSASVTGCFLSDEIKGRQVIGKKKKKEAMGHTKQLINVFGPNNNAFFLMTDTLGNFMIFPEQMLALRGGYVYLKPMLNKNEYKPFIITEEPFNKADSLRKSSTSYISYINPSQVFSELPIDYPVISQDSTILLSEVTITGKKRRIFRDKFMGRLDSLAQIMNSAYVCTSCGLLLDYRFDYQGHHAINGCPAKGKEQPINGKSYPIAKYQHHGPAKGGGTAFSVIDSQTIIYEGPIYSEEELLRMNNLWRVKGYYGKREFYQPDELDMRSPMPDARNVLLWKPDIVTDEKGEAEVDFHCSDINTGFVGVVEGTDGLGSLGTTQCEFRVLRK